VIRFNLVVRVVWGPAARGFADQPIWGRRGTKPNPYNTGVARRPAARVRPARYTQDVTVQTFKEMLTARPFQPVRLVVSSGQTYEIRHPEMAFLTRTSILIGTGSTDDGVPAVFKIISLLHVTAIEPIEAANAA
jgi:hypothetical protein